MEQINIVEKSKIRQITYISNGASIVSKRNEKISKIMHEMLINSLKTGNRTGVLVVWNMDYYATQRKEFVQ